MFEAIDLNLRERIVNFVGPFFLMQVPLRSHDSKTQSTETPRFIVSIIPIPTLTTHYQHTRKSFHHNALDPFSLTQLMLNSRSSSCYDSWTYLDCACCWKFFLSS